MPNLYNGFCYELITDAANAEIGSGVVESGSGVASPVSFATVSTTTGNLTYSYISFPANTVSSVSVLRTYPTCSSVGYLTNYSGVELADVVTTSWLVILTWVIAFAIKSIRRAM